MKGTAIAFPVPPHTLAFGQVRSTRRPTRAEDVRDQSSMATTRYEARGNARKPEGGTPGRQRIDCQLFHSDQYRTAT